MNNINPLYVLTEGKVGKAIDDAINRAKTSNPIFKMWKDQGRDYLFKDERKRLRDNAAFGIKRAAKYAPQHKEYDDRSHYELGADIGKDWSSNIDHSDRASYQHIKKNVKKGVGREYERKFGASGAAKRGARDAIYAAWQADGKK